LGEGERTGHRTLTGNIETLRASRLFLAHSEDHGKGERLSGSHPSGMIP
jgi:hypothetical protein